MIHRIWIIVFVGIREAWRKRSIGELRTTWFLLRDVRPWRRP
jgi:hypothetical protein